MLKDINSLFPIYKIEGKYLYSKSGMQYILISIKSSFTQDAIKLQNILDHFSHDVSLFILKDQASDKDFESHLLDILERNIQGAYTYQALKYSKSFKEHVHIFFMYRIFLLTQITQEEQLDSIEKVLTTNSFLYEICNASAIKEFFSKCFPHI